MTEPFKIDVHSHIVPDLYAKGYQAHILPAPYIHNPKKQPIQTPNNKIPAVKAFGSDPSGWPQPTWTIDSTLAFMKKACISKSILSITAPGATISPNPPALARLLNEYTAKLRDNTPESLGFFASMPNLYDVKATVEEIRYSLDVLNANGVILLTSYEDPKQEKAERAVYLGNPIFEEIMAELNARKAVVFVHPTHSFDTSLVDPLLFQPVIDYTHETTKTAMDLIMSGTKGKFKNIKFILSHAGGTLPYVIERAAKMLPRVPLKAEFESMRLSEERILEDARSFYFDLALSCSAIQLRGLLDFVGPERIFYGSDFPYAPEGAIMGFADELRDSEMSDAVRERIYNGTAEEVFPSCK